MSVRTKNKFLKWPGLVTLGTDFYKIVPHNPEAVGSSPTAATRNRWNQPIPAVFSNFSRAKTGRDAYGLFLMLI